MTLLRYTIGLGTLCFVLLLSCYQTRNSFTDDDIATNPDTTDPNANNLFAPARTILKETCDGSSCHGSGAANTKFSLFTTQQQFIESLKVSASGTACDSEMYQRLDGSGCNVGNENMPLGTALSTNQVNTIRLWLECLDDGAC